MRCSSVLCSLALTLGNVAPVGLAAQAGVVAGTVVNRATGAPVAAAQVTVAGTTLRAFTDASGRFALNELPGATAVLQVRVPYINMTKDSLRVPFSFRGDSSVTHVPLYQQRKYTSSSDPIRLASGHEGQLITAEADLAASDFAHADSIINIFRAVGGDTAIASTDPDTVKAALVDQRRREFFLEGQHLGDAIRFGLPLNPPQGTAYPGGGTYGTQVCLPIPDVEKQNNPNFP